MAFPHHQMNGGDQPPSAATRHRQRHPCTARRRRAMWRQAEQRQGRCAIGAAPPVEANARPALARQGERQERQRVSPKTPLPQGARSAGKSATLENPAHFQRTARNALAPVIVTVRPRRQRRLGEVSPRRRDCGIERGAGMPAGDQSSALASRSMRFTMLGLKDVIGLIIPFQFQAP